MQLDLIPSLKENLKVKLGQAKKSYPDLWQSVIRDWNENQSGNSAWLTYAANYLFNTVGVRWAIDPYSMSSRVSGIAQPDFSKDLQKLELVALTHSHSDHLDLTLIRSIAHLPIQWIIPQHMLKKVHDSTPLQKSQIIVPENGKIIHYRGIALTPFDSLHMHNLGGVSETGYLVEFDDQRWLFPADIRNYNISLFPDFGKLDGVFAHLWLGKGHGLSVTPPELLNFCNFFGSLATSRLVIAHLDEFGRESNELWDENHFHLVANKFFDNYPGKKIEMAKMGMKVIL